MTLSYAVKLFVVTVLGLKVPSMSMVVVKKCNMSQSGNVKKMCLFFLALGIQFG